jgi:hypothetical protein
MSRHIFFLLFSLGVLVSCANPIKKAVTDAKYSALEMVGLEKRDLFKREVSGVREDQEDTGEAFKDALTKLKEVYSFDGGNLEKQYSKLNSSYENAQEEAADVTRRIASLDKVAQDLFIEWRAEIKEIQSGSLRSKSSSQLSETKERYQALHTQLKKSEAKMAPVLTRLKDQVLFLKHNLNAKAVAGLKNESQKIETDIQKLITDIEKSNKEAEEFIKTL